MSADRRPVLVCFDGSGDSVAAINCGATLLPTRSAEVLNVWTVPLSEAETRRRLWRGDASLDEMMRAFEQAGAAQASGIVEEGTAVAQAAGWQDARPLVQRTLGGVWFDIVRLAEERDAAVVLLGARGVTGVKAPLGSVSDGVVHYSRRPVLVVPGEIADEARQRWRDGPVLLAYDGSEPARRAIVEAGALFAGRSAVVAHVAAGDDGDSIARDGETIARAAGFDATSRVEQPRSRPWDKPGGRSWRGIVDAADRAGAAVVVVGSRGRSATRELLLGSVAKAVLHRCGRAVMVVPCPQARAPADG